MTAACRWCYSHPHSPEEAEVSRAPLVGLQEAKVSSRDRCSVLVVEDDQAIADFVASVLGEEGYQVEVVPSGEGGLDAVARVQPSVILLDLLLPVMSGPAFLEELHRRYGHTIPVIIMTAAREEARPEEGVSAEGQLLKPFELRDLLAEIRRVLEQRECVS